MVSLHAPLQGLCSSCSLIHLVCFTDPCSHPLHCHPSQILFPRAVGMKLKIICSLILLYFRYGWSQGQISYSEIKNCSFFPHAVENWRWSFAISCTLSSLEYFDILLCKLLWVCKKGMSQLSCLGGFSKNPQKTCGIYSVLCGISGWTQGTWVH